MKTKTGFVARSVLVALGLVLVWVPALWAQSGAQAREIQEHLRQLRAQQEAHYLAQIEEERGRVEKELASIREHQLQEIMEARVETQEQLQALQEHQLQELVQRQARMEGQVQREARERREQERLQQEEARRRALAVRVRGLGEQARERAERLRQVFVNVQSRARIGVSLDGRQGREYDRQGVLVKGVMNDSPAEKAGLEEGDIITHLDGRSLLDPLPEDQEKELDEYQSLPVQRLMALARELEDGQEVEIRYLRDGTSEDVTLEAAEMGPTWFEGESFPGGMVFRVDPDERGTWSFRMPESGVWMRGLEGLEGLKELEDLEIEIPEIQIEELHPNWEHGDRNIRIFRGGDDVVLGLGGVFSRAYGLSLRGLTPELGEYFSTDHGVLVLESEENSDLGLLPGDVILAIDGREVEDRMDVFRILRSYEEGEAVSFQIMRHGQETRVQGTVG